MASRPPPPRPPAPRPAPAPGSGRRSGTVDGNNRGQTGAINYTPPPKAPPRPPTK